MNDRNEIPRIAADMMAGDIPNWLVTLGSSLLTAMAGFILALLNRGPAMQTAVTAATKTLMDSYQARVDDLMREVELLREGLVEANKEIVALRKALDDRYRSNPTLGF